MADIKLQQIILPMQVFLGDDAELNCDFNSSDESLSLLISNGQNQLSVENFLEPVDNDEVEITDIQLFQNGVDYYKIKIHFRAWKTGKIQFPPIKIGDTVVKFEPVNIASLSEKLKETSIRNTAPPLLLPNTSYKIGGIIFSFFIVCLGIILFIIQRKKLLFCLKNFRLKCRYKRNKKITMGKLKNLQNIEDDKKFVQDYQLIMRNYLEIRFDFPFTRSTTSQISTDFLNKNQNLFSKEKYELFLELVSIFIRTDYIKYNVNKKFLENERRDVLEKTVMVIDFLEKSDVQEKDSFNKRVSEKL